MEIAILVNNAGVGDHGLRPFRMESTPLRTPAECDRPDGIDSRFVQSMQAQNSADMNVASTAAFCPYPDTRLMGRGASFVLRFSEALRLENRKMGVVVSALYPGPIRTEFAERAGHNLSAFQDDSTGLRFPAPAGAPWLVQGKSVLRLRSVDGVECRFDAVCPEGGGQSNCRVDDAV